MSRKDLILSLIKDDLINTKLVDSLNQLGMQADQYRLHLCITIFKLTRIKATPQLWEKIYREYFDKTQQILSVDVVESPKSVDALAEEIYTLLKTKKNGLIP